jgi:hypothetical protein
MTSGFNCKGICERYDLKRRPNYANGDVFCRVCSKSYTREFFESMPKINPKFAYCFCCHARVGISPRSKRSYTYYRDCQARKGYEHLKTFDELGLTRIHRELKNNIIAREERIKNGRY